jgi:hypothetical protein
MRSGETPALALALALACLPLTPNSVIATTPSANGATYTSLGQRPRKRHKPSPFRSAEGWSAAAGETTELPSSISPTTPIAHHAKPLAGRAGPVKPLNPLKITKPPITTGDLYFQNLA